MASHVNVDSTQGGSDRADSGSDAELVQVADSDLGTQPAAFRAQPNLIGSVPVPADELLARSGWQIIAVETDELNEGFAAHSLAVIRPDDDIVNAGAIPFGHPLTLGCSAGGGFGEVVRRRRCAPQRRFLVAIAIEAL